MTQVTSLANIMDEYLGDIDPACHQGNGMGQYPFGLRVGCVKMAAPRDPRFDFIRELGASEIGKVFYQEELEGGVLTFVFPERHMSVHEQQAFMSAMTKHPDVKGITQVDILTSSPLIIGSFQRESIRILTWENDMLYCGR